MNGRPGISVEIAIRLSKAFGSMPGTWLAMQMASDLWQAHGRGGEVAVERFVSAGSSKHHETISREGESHGTLGPSGQTP